MTAYYNEIDPFAAQWLRNLIDAGHIATGVVDTRSIEEVTANDLKGFTQCHFFAGIGVWSYALRRAGWPDDRPVWTGSCPCQPFSACGKKKGKSDKRHLFPTWARLISECRPDVIFGEQVAGKDGLDWLDDVRNHLEGESYAFAAFDLCAAGFGAPHIRQRLFWVADAEREQCQKRLSGSSEGHSQNAGGSAIEPTGLCLSGGLEHADSNGRERRICGREDSKREAFDGSVGCDGAACGLADTNDDRQQSGCRRSSGCEPQKSRNNPGRGSKACGVGNSNSGDEDTFTGIPSRKGSSTSRSGDIAAPTNGHWRDADWLFCHDGKWRPVKPGLKPLANGVAGRVGQLRAYGNAIVAPVAEAFIAAYMDGAR
ncbi:DNA cytosine methyltransferase [Trabulsiella odontotermitis]|uniref:DNA cytosine methyltransferase n=1 Tax=Trabulsiella odontotermitis TaxID=379893 RepID=UPI0006760EF9|nr:DNA cytosine methyltransferase [Trabulsiella odontotermitis]